MDTEGTPDNVPVLGWVRVPMTGVHIRESEFQDNRDSDLGMLLRERLII